MRARAWAEPRCRARGPSCCGCCRPSPIASAAVSPPTTSPAAGVGYLFATQDSLLANQFWRLAIALGEATTRLFATSAEILDAIERGEVLIGYNVLGSYALARQQAGAPDRHRAAARLHLVDVARGGDPARRAPTRRPPSCSSTTCSRRAARPPWPPRPGMRALVQAERRGRLPAGRRGQRAADHAGPGAPGLPRPHEARALPRRLGRGGEPAYKRSRTRRFTGR